MNRNKQLACQMQQIFDDIFAYYIALYELPEKDDLFLFLEEFKSRKEDNKTKILECLLKSILNCPSKNEIQNSLRFFESKNAVLDSVYRRKEFLQKLEQETIISRNLRQPSFPLFEEIGREWTDPRKKSKCPGQSWHLIKTSEFAPSLNEMLAPSYERCLRILKLKKFPEYAELITRWLHRMQKAIFTGSEWSSKEQKYLCSNWQKELFFFPHPRHGALKERHESSWGIDYEIASRFILYFCDKFIATPYKTELGEIGCFLWLMVRLSHGLDKIDFPLNTIISIKKGDFSRGLRTINIQDHRISLSQSLEDLFYILSRGKMNNEKLLPNLTEKKLIAMFHRASEELLQPLQKQVSPDAFRVFPHPFLESRIPQSRLYSMRNPKCLELQPGNRVRGLLKHFQLPTFRYFDRW